MKTFKQLLWFIIPTIIIPVLLLLNFMQSINYPKFIGPQNYMRLLINDPLFLKALLNTLAIPTAAALVGGLIIYLIKLLFFGKANTKRVTPVYYTCLFVASSTIFHITANLTTFFGIPQQAYSARTIMQHTSDYSAWRLMNIPINFSVILISMQAGVLVCFVFWLVDKAVSKLTGKSKTNDISTTSETSN
ncbi:MAG: hypothetical protein ACYCYM_12040 [Saccharofermentanales bacterium]